MKKWWFRLLLTLAIVVLVCFGWLLSSGVHSQNAVEQYKAQLRAGGEKLSIRDLIPPPVKAESNGAEFFNQVSSFLGANPGMLVSNDPPIMRMISPGKAMVGWQQAEIIKPYGDFATNTWQDLEDALRPQAYVLELLHKTVSRPDIDFGEDYDSVPENTRVEPLIKMKAAALLISPTVISDLHHGDTASAVTNLHTLLLLLDLWRGSSLVQLSRMGMVSIACGDQWEVLQATNITDAQMALLQRDWETMDFTRSFEKSLVMERNFQFVEIEHLRTSNSPSEAVANWFGPGGGAAGSGGLRDELSAIGRELRRKAADTVWRSVWSYEDELSALRANQAMVEAMRRVNGDGFFKDALADLDKGANVSNSNYSWLRKNLDTNIWSTLQESTTLTYGEINRVLVAEVARRVAITAIGLRRYRLRHGYYPSALSALVPEILSQVPNDPVDGKSLRYHVSEDDTFVLYSIGQDGKDGGGDLTPVARFKTLYWLYGADSVWPKPAALKEVQNYYDHSPK